MDSGAGRGDVVPVRRLGQFLFPCIFPDNGEMAETGSQQAMSAANFMYNPPLFQSARSSAG